MTFGSKKLWVYTLGLTSVVGLAAAGKGDPAAYGAIGMMTTAALTAIGALDYKKTPPQRDTSKDY